MARSLQNWNPQLEQMKIPVSCYSQQLQVYLRVSVWGLLARGGDPRAWVVILRLSLGLFVVPKTRKRKCQLGYRYRIRRMLDKEPEMLGMIPNIRDLKGHPNEVRWGWLQYSPMSARAYTMPKLFLKSKKGGLLLPADQRAIQITAQNLCALGLSPHAPQCDFLHTHTHTITQPSRTNSESGCGSFQSKENKRPWREVRTSPTRPSIGQTCCSGPGFSMNRKGKQVTRDYQTVWREYSLESCW